MTVNAISGALALLGFPGSASGSNTSTTLTNAFVNGTSGDAIGVRFMARTTDTIDAIWVYVTAVTGSPVLAGTVLAENTGGFPTRAGTAAALDTSTAADTPAANTWCKITFGSPYTPAVGEILWVVVHKTSGTTCDIRTANAGIFPIGLTHQVHDTVYTTTGGYSANGTLATETPHIIKQGSNYFGNPFTQRSTTFYTSNTLERGIKFTAPFSCSVCGVVFDGSSANYANVNLYGSGGTPGGTALATWDLDSDAGETSGDLSQGKIFDSTVPITAGLTYFLTLTYSGNTQNPPGMEIENYASYTTEFDAIRDVHTGMAPVSVVDNGAGGWTVAKNFMPHFALLVSDYRGFIMAVNSAELVG